ncbi:MAG: hypothetical protein AMXMBFR7_11780 [Planctomycetota bacterium]
MASAVLPPIRPQHLLPHWEMLCNAIGERRAGSAAEHRAAEYLLEQYRRLGCADVRLEAFPCRMLKRAEARIEIPHGKRWVRVPCSVLAGSPSTTPADRPVERELVWLELPDQKERLKPGSLKGKALLVFGPLSTDTDGHRKLVRSGAEVILWVDDRLPMEWPKADGLLPEWVRLHGARPTVGVAYRSAYQWRIDGVKRVRACVRTEVVDAVSYNVVADWPGRDPKAGMVAFGCHYDTQLGNPGADDNASGTVSLLALARVLALRARKKPTRRGLRFISFGTEEQLSVGAKHYVLKHRREMNAHALLFNFDSLSSALGHTDLLIAGAPAVGRWAVERLAQAGLEVRPHVTITPFGDHFPLTVYGVPAVWYHRSNFPGGRWQHHSPHDHLGTVSPEALCRVLNAAAPLALEAAETPKLPFPRGMPKEQRPEILRLARDLFDLPV